MPSSRIARAFGYCYPVPSDRAYPGIQSGGWFEDGVASPKDSVTNYPAGCEATRGQETGDQTHSRELEGAQWGSQPDRQGFICYCVSAPC